MPTLFLLFEIVFKVELRHCALGLLDVPTLIAIFVVA